MKIPLSAPDVQEEEIESVAAVLRSPHLSLGPKLEEFEHAIAGYVGAGNAIGAPIRPRATPADLPPRRRARRRSVPGSTEASFGATWASSIWRRAGRRCD